MKRRYRDKYTAPLLDPGMRMQRTALVNDDQLREIMLRRLLIVALLSMVAVLATAARYWYLQVPLHERYAARSHDNRVRLVVLPPVRGLIHDRRGVLLADNRPAYRLELVRERLSLPVAEVVAQLATRVRITAADRSRFERRLQQRPAFAPVVLRYDLTEQEVARLAVDRFRQPGVEITPYMKRYYPFGSLFTHVLGYVGRISSEELERLDRDNYRGTEYVGKSGVEGHYEALLHGRSGYQRVETNAAGRVVDVLKYQAPVPGEPLHLTLDMRLQRAAAMALGENAGAVVALEAASGEVLAMYSAPGFDPNLFVNGISARDYQRLLNDPRRPLFNRFLQGGYEPGSTVKPFIALVALQQGVVTPEEVFHSTGAFYLPNQERAYRDWKRGGHGLVSLRDGIVESINTVFYDLALRLGIDRLHDGLAQFGFGRPTGIDLAGEAAGVLPSRAWKRRRIGQAWFPGETVIAGIGQGYNVVTPMQLAQATALLATGGHTWQPHLRRGGGADPVLVQTIDEPAWSLVRNAMIDVLYSATGTARASASEEFLMAGKSGTAQVYGRAQGQEFADNEIRQLRDHALFIAYAPVSRDSTGLPPDSPGIAVAVVVEHGGGGSRVAAPVARDVIRAWMELSG